MYFVYSATASALLGFSIGMRYCYLTFGRPRNDIGPIVNTIASCGTTSVWKPRDIGIG